MQKDMTKEFNEHVENWVEISQKHGKTSNAAGEYYDKHILPHVKEKFIEKNSPEEDKYDGLILTVGGSPEPVILSISAIKSKKIGLICTKGRKKSIDRIVKQTHLQPSDLISAGCEVDGGNTIEIYQAIMDFYTKWNEPKKIALGITGGTKVMSSVAAMAGAILGADIYYVDTNAKNKLNKPVPCSEYLRRLSNPYTVFGDFEIGKAKQLFERHDYAGTRGIFHQLKSKVGDANKAKIYEAYEYLCTAYEAWDNLDIDEAKTSLDQLVEILEQFDRLEGLRPLQGLKSRLKNQIRALEILLQFRKDEGLALKATDGFHFAFMLYHNALRRAQQGKYDIACLILYRLLEWIEQHRLAIIGIDTKEPDYSQSGKKLEELFCLYREKRNNAYKSAKKPDSAPAALPDKIALVEGFLILDALDDDIVTKDKKLQWGPLLGKLEIRNQSIFAHGMKKIGEEEFENFKSIVDDLFKKAKKLAAIDTDTYDEQHKFIAPLP